MKVSAPAKINLFLHVTGRRPDGYHTLFTLMVPVSLYDELEIDTGPGSIRVACDDPRLPGGRHNLAFQAASVFLQHCENLPGVQPRPGISIFIRKQIPLAAGLGGGSSDAAAVLTGLNRHYGYPFSPIELNRMGLEIGADVPFFLYGRPAVVTGIGEIIAPYPHSLPYHILLVFPGIRVSTAQVYKNLDLGLTNCEKKLKDFVLKDRPFDAAFHSCNDLESVTLAKYPQVKAAKTAVSGSGAQGVLMSGSGSTIFGLFENVRAAQRAMRTLERNSTSNWQLILTELVAAADDSRQFR